MSNNELSKLTDREREVLKLIAEGNTSKEIAKALAISYKTIDAHRENIKRKTDIDSIAGLTRLAVRNKLIEA